MSLKNRYEIKGDDLILYLDKKDGSVYETVVSARHLPKLQEFNHKWSLSSHGYAVVRNKDGCHYLHRFLSLASSDVLVDHIDGDRLNNRDSNLRFTDKVGNSQNITSTGKRNRSGKLNVHKVGNGRHRAQVKDGDKRVHLGYFDTPEQAYDAVFHYRANHIPMSHEASMKGGKDSARVLK